MEPARRMKEVKEIYGGNDMKKRILSMIITLALVFGCGAMQAFAADAKVTASLPADKKTVSSGYAAFQATNMFGKVYDISKYPIKVQSMGINRSGEVAKEEAVFNCAVGCEYSLPFRGRYNMHKVVLTCWNINAPAKGSIGYGYIE